MEEDVTVLGERVGGRTCGDDLDADAHDHYRRALEHYDQAKHLLAASETTEDVLAIEQVVADARYHRAAVIAVIAGDPVPPRREPCFFNPRRSFAKIGTLNRREDLELTAEIERNVAAALAEDVGAGDWTARLTPEGRRAQAGIVCRVDAVLCGRPWFEACFRRLDPDVRIDWLRNRSESVSAGSQVCELSGDTRALLTGERTGLNFLQLLSAVATETRRYVEAVKGTRAAIVDTRKTLPGLRLRTEVRGALWWRFEPPPGPLRWHPDQGKPHRSCRQRHGRARACARD